MRFQLIRTYRGHQGTVCSLAAVPGYARIVSSSLDGLIKIWDLRSDSSRVLRDGASGYAAVLRVFPAGFFMASGNSEGQVRLWNLETGEVVRTMSGHQGSITALAITHNGQRLISGSQDRILHIWNAIKGTLMHVCNGYHGSVDTVAITPDDNIVLAGSIKGEPLKAWYIETGHAVTAFQLMAVEERDTAILQDGKRLLFAGSGSVMIRDVYTGESRTAVKTDPHVMALMPGQKSIVIGGQKSSLALWHLDTGEKIYQFDEPSDQVTSLAVTPDGRYVVAGCHDGSLDFYMRVS